jgi:hypothetical protein
VCEKNGGDQIWNQPKQKVTFYLYHSERGKCISLWNNNLG